MNDILVSTLKKMDQALVAKQPSNAVAVRYSSNCLRRLFKVGELGADIYKDIFDPDRGEYSKKVIFFGEKMIAVGFKWDANSKTPPHIHHGSGAAIITGGLFDITHYKSDENKRQVFDEVLKGLKAGSLETVFAGVAHSVSCITSAEHSYGTSLHIYHIREGDYPKLNELVDVLNIGLPTIITY